jgi:hypothetical protein
MSETTSPSTRSRSLLAGVALIAPPAVIALTFFLWQSELPGRVASHWSDLGAADDSLPTRGVFLAAIISSGVAMVAGLVAIALPRFEPRAIRTALFWFGMVQGIAAAIWIVPAWLTFHAGSAEGAVLGPWILVLAACTLYGAVPFAIYPRPDAPDVSSPEPLRLAPTETGAWTGSITAGVFVWATVIVGALTVGIAIALTREGADGGAAFAFIVMLLALVATSSFIRLRVTIDWRGLRVVSWLFRIPLKRIPLPRIRAVESTDLWPSEWGGWGYRISPGRSAVILRAGPGMVVTTVDDKQFAITLDEPDTPAALLAGLSDPAPTETPHRAR